MPVDSTSLTGVTYGSSTDNNELLKVLPTIGGPEFSLATAPLASEVRLHPSLGPNPDMGLMDNDDIDALDAYGTGVDCPFKYISVDHEASMGFDPGIIYEVIPGMGLVPVIDPVIHLGLSPGVDIDAFEFVFTRDASGTEVFSLLFSVDFDDPLTPMVDESGNPPLDPDSPFLDPFMVYVSNLDGTFRPFFSDPFSDDVDAIAAWCKDVDLGVNAVVQPLPCPGDANHDGVVNFADVTSVLGNWLNDYTADPSGTGPGDANGDGLVNFADVTSVLGNWLATCP